MTKAAVFLIAISVSALAVAQQDAIQLGTAVPVDTHVTNVFWHQNGHSLVYERKEESGKSLGIYALGKFQGKSLVPLKDGDTYSVSWLGGSDDALIVVRGKDERAPTKSNRIQIFVLDGENQKSKSLYSESFEDKSTPRVEVNTSPLLKHAIVTFRLGKESHHKVLLLSGSDFVNSPDLDRAEANGASGPIWSIDGTAIYSDQSASPNQISKIVTTPSRVANLADGVIAEKYKAEKMAADEAMARANQLSGSGQQGGAAEDAKRDVELKVLAYASLVRRTPATGTPVYELMPTNAILRPVRFQRPYVNKGFGEGRIVPKQQSIVLKYDQSNAQDQSVWVKRDNEKNSPATLVGVHVERTWLSFTNSAVGYTIDGALFVRTIK